VLNRHDDPAWSARIAICGLHCVPKMNSDTGTNRKKSSDSYSTDRTMPMVVRIATSEQPRSAKRTTCSTRLRACMVGVMRRIVIQPPATAMHSASTARAVRLSPSSRCQCPAAAATSGATAFAGTLPAMTLRTSFRTSDNSPSDSDWTSADIDSTTRSAMMR
jgi:hypothetical protein